MFNLADLDKVDVRAVFERLMTAYNISSYKELTQALNVSAGIVSNRIKNGTFPFDHVVKCTLDTGASLPWLLTGISDDEITKDKNANELSSLFSQISRVDRWRLELGVISESAATFVDKKFLIGGISSPLIIDVGTQTHITDRKFDAITNGRWAATVFEAHTGIYDVIHFGKNTFQLSGGEYGAGREFSVEDIKFIAKVKTTCTNEAR